HSPEQARALELRKELVRSVWTLVIQCLEALSVERPEPLGVAPEDLDMRDLHWVHALPQASLRRTEVGDARRHGDAGAGERHGPLRVQHQLGQTARWVPASHRPRKCGVRFERNAPMPSRASSESKTRSNAAFSASMPASRSPAAETRLICSTA